MMGKRKKASLAAAEEILWTVLEAGVSKDSPDWHYWKTVERPSVERALDILAKHTLRDARKAGE